AEVRRRAFLDWRCEGSAPIAAEESDGSLLISGERQSVIEASDRARDQPAVVPPGKCHPRAGLPKLIAQMCSLLEGLIVIDAENRGIDRGIESQAAVLRAEVARPGMTHRRIPLKPVNIRSTYPNRYPVELGLFPGDGKCDGCVKEQIEVVCV